MCYHPAFGLEDDGLHHPFPGGNVNALQTIKLIYGSLSNLQVVECTYFCGDVIVMVFWTVTDP